jgi:Protein of unknown function (DUF3108)
VRTRTHLAAALPFLAMLLLIALGLPGSPAKAAPAPVILEKLDYQVSLGPWSDVARVHLVLKELEPGHYLAEFSGAAQGMWQLLSRWLPERYQTEMVLREGRLLPLVYREEFMYKGKHIRKEFRFDHQPGRLTLWRQADGGEMRQEWEVPLKGPVSDLLSLFYNVRLGALGPLPGGDTLRVAVLPTPKPQELVFRIGPATDQGHKVMLDVRQPESGAVDHYFIYLNPERVPTLAWTRVTLFGKLAGHLLNPGEIKKEGLLALPPAAAPVPKAQP